MQVFQMWAHFTLHYQNDHARELHHDLVRKALKLREPQSSRWRMQGFQNAGNKRTVSAAFLQVTAHFAHFRENVCQVPEPGRPALARRPLPARLCHSKAAPGAACDPHGHLPGQGWHKVSTGTRRRATA